MLSVSLQSLGPQIGGPVWMPRLHTWRDYQQTDKDKDKGNESDGNLPEWSTDPIEIGDIR